jgi:chromate transporter
MPYARLAFMARHFAALSLLAFGGTNTVLPEIHRQLVDVTHWISDTQFADLFAIAQAAPGPNTLIVTLIGWRVAGIAGAIVATAAMCVPAALLTYVVSKVWNRFRDTRWRAIIQQGIMPITVGMVAASAFILARTAAHSSPEFMVMAATALLTYKTRFNPLWALGIAALLGLTGAFGGA